MYLGGCRGASRTSMAIISPPSHADVFPGRGVPKLPLSFPSAVRLLPSAPRFDSSRSAAEKISTRKRRSSIAEKGHPLVAPVARPPIPPGRGQSCQTGSEPVTHSRATERRSAAGNSQITAAIRRYPTRLAVATRPGKPPGPPSSPWSPPRARARAVATWTRTREWSEDRQ